MRKCIIILLLAICTCLTLTISKALELNFSNINAQSLMDKFSDVHFVGKGNDFGGSIFWLATKSLSGGIDIHINGDTKHCTKLIRGIYYNNQRGKRVRPLDTLTLGLLQASDTSYHGLTVTGGLYTSCNEPYSIFGSLEFNWSGSLSYIIAGTELNYPGNDYLPAFANSFQYFNNTTPIGYIWDSKGGIGFVGGDVNDHETLIDYLNNGGNINSGFTYSGTDIIPLTGSQTFTETSTGTTATNTLRNLIIQGTVGLSQSLDNEEKTALLGNPQDNTVILNGNMINNANIVNTAKANAEKLCKGKTWLSVPSLPSAVSSESTLCFTDTTLTIDLATYEPDYHNKTIIMKSGNIILENSMKIADGGLDLLIDKGNLYLPVMFTDYQNFDTQGFPVDNGGVNSGMLIKGNIIINGLLLGGSPTNETGFAHKLFIQGKFSSLNSPLTPTQGRIALITNLLGSFYIPYINLQNIFTWECGLSGIGSDTTPCGNQSNISRVPLVIIDGNFATRLLK